MNLTFFTSQLHRRFAAAATGTAVLVGAGCSTGSTDRAVETTVSAAPATTPTTSTTSTIEPPTFEPPTIDGDRDIDVDGTRVHLRCAGDGATTVVLIAGYEGASDAWSAVEPALANRTRTCSYDRPGTGSSDPATDTATFATQAQQLDALLDAAGERGPFVVVGHSFGGAAAVTFASSHPDDVAGVVLVDATPADWPTQICAVAGDGSPAATTLRGLCDSWASPDGNVERLDVLRAFAGVANVTSLESMPLSVLTATERELPDGLARSEVDRLNSAWMKGQGAWTRLSAAGTLVAVPDSSHYIQLDHPDVVIDAIGALLALPQ